MDYGIPTANEIPQVTRQLLYNTIDSYSPPLSYYLALRFPPRPGPSGLGRPLIHETCNAIKGMLYDYNSRLKDIGAQRPICFKKIMACSAKKIFLGYGAKRQDTQIRNRTLGAKRRHTQIRNRTLGAKRLHTQIRNTTFGAKRRDTQIRNMTLSSSQIR